MYFYFYDQFAQEKQYEVLLTKIETQLIELGINGRIEKLAMFKNTRELIEDGIKKGAHTIVAVGNDATFANLVNIVARFPVTLGFIPLQEHSRFARVLGVPMGSEACIVLSRRRTMTMDVGVVDGVSFLGSLHLPANIPFHIQCDESYSVTATNADVSLLNLGNIFDNQDTPLRIAAVDDGKLQLLVTPRMERGFLKNRYAADLRESIFFVEHLRIEPVNQQEVKLYVDGQINVVAPCEVNIHPHSLKVIVGRERKIGRSD